MRDNQTTDRGDHSQGDADIKRRAFVKSAGVIGMASALGWSAASPASADPVSEWPDPEDEYYSTLVGDLQSQGLPPGTFVYADDETDTASMYSLTSDLAETSSIDVSSEDVPFSEALRVDVTEEPAHTYDVSYRADVPDTAITQGDVLLGVVYLRGPESSDSPPTMQYTAKDDAHPATNMVTSTAQVRPGSTWTRYYFPLQFTYDAEAGTWRTEMFLGFGQQTIDIGGLAVVYFGDTVSPDRLPSGPAGVGEGGGDWEKAAEKRIQKLRTADLTVDVTDVDGNPVENADIDVEMREHEFGFGGSLSADYLINETEEGDPYREQLKRLFNKVWFGNYHKWRFWETGESVSDRATQWALNNGFDIRGHVCLWANVAAYAVPKDVVQSMGVTWEDNGVTDPQLDPDYVKLRTLEHVQAIIDDYKGYIDEWQIVNELQHKPGFVRAINGVPADQPMDADPLTSDILAEWYHAARVVGSDSMTLGVNDYNVLGGPYFSTRDEYIRQIEFLKENASLDSVGLQCHLSRGSALTPQQTMAGLDRYAEHDVLVRITEFDMAGENWADEDKADFFHDFLKTVFSHESVDEFSTAGMLNSRHSGSVFYGESFEDPKPALGVYENLVFEEWWTEETGRTDSAGTYATTGFKGDYEITASDGEVSRTVSATLSDGGQTVEVALDPNAPPEPESDDVDLPIDDTTVTLPDHDVIAQAQPSVTDMATVGQRVTFQVKDTTGDDRWIDSLEWSFGDGSSASGWWAAHRFDSQGAYRVSLTATDNQGGTTTDTVMVLVEDLAEELADIQPSTTDTTTDERVTFEVKDTTGDDRWIDSLEWSFGDGSSASGWWAAHRFDSPGTYTVALTATDNTGHSTTRKVDITVT